jgi:hypothetical protein
MDDLPTQDPGGQDPFELWEQAASQALRLTQPGMRLHLEHAVLQPNEPYRILEGITVEAWYDAAGVPSRRHKWVIERIHTYAEIIERVPPDRREFLNASNSYVSLHNLYRIRIQVAGSPAWFVAAWEPTLKGSGGRIIETLHGVERCTSPKQATQTLSAALRWVRQNVKWGGRTWRKKSNITPGQEREIKAVMYAKHSAGMTNPEITSYLNEHHKPARYLRNKPWNKELVRRWLKEEVEDRHKNGTEIDTFVNE